MAEFQPKITRARFVVSPFSSEQMTTLAGVLRDSMRTRMLAGLSVSDSPAKPLTPKYAATKQRRGGQPVRDWKLTGKTLNSMAVLSASENRAVIGFSDPRAARIAAFNQRKERSFGVAPRDRQKLVEAVHQMRVVKAGRGAA